MHLVGILVITSSVVLLRRNHLIFFREIISTMLILMWWMMSLEKQNPLFLDMWAVLLFCLSSLRVRKRRRFLWDWCALTYWMRISSLAAI